jgi:hypothetical protein
VGPSRAQPSIASSSGYMRFLVRAFSRMFLNPGRLHNFSNAIDRVVKIVPKIFSCYSVVSLEGVLTALVYGCCVSRCISCEKLVRSRVSNLTILPLCSGSSPALMPIKGSRETCGLCLVDGRQNTVVVEKCPLSHFSTFLHFSRWLDLL